MKGVTQKYGVKKGNLYEHLDEDETHWFENYISDSFVFAEFFVPGNYKTIWENPEKVCTWIPTGKDISGRPAVRNIAKHVAGQGKDV